MPARLGEMPRLIALLAAVFVASGCSGAPPGPPSSPPATSSANPATPSAPATSSLYLRAWLTQALPPPAGFARGPLLTVSDGVLVDFNVAVPAIFPGPLLILPNGRSITDAGETALIEEARRLGLLSGAGDLTGGGLVPGAEAAQLVMVVDGVTYELTGDPARPIECDGRRCSAQPGTPDAFTAYWRLLADTSWLEPQLGSQQTYIPERLAVLIGPVAEPEAGIEPNRVAWPLETSLAEFGQPFAGREWERCGVGGGDEQAALLNVLRKSNQLTVFIDDAGNARSLMARPLVPGEPSPCAQSA